ncbi:protein C1orf43 homolog [Amphibalanus amphitrite]|uniref:protein C1orf43 homolog n=1 Tax=Amphibalanus amphitrite TaxID=1232801 RepID=UPI001C90D87D|nr:protein C1orf43 homolog [Amphibalanus amphitrite]XP_043193485.1 protein C1orf43 homolog [Amphibalanus amphitrite]XP_043193486.1 protein C1orf43 homolog [Amphibalanus amphitrite]XP_043193487.1 protein C1orf43 homolog [Amphibalanus amphitrite]XP_043193488.1 protein C1orf43 homolog [Amphibalanus amphitrite]
MADTKELPGVLVVIFIAGGVLAFLVVFIFGKRQIQRFALKNQKGPHVPVGVDAKKTLKREIERRLDRTADVVSEPLLLCPAVSPSEPFYYRMKAVDDARRLELEVAEWSGVRRPPTDTVRRFLMSLCGTLLSRAGPRVIHEFCDHYELARYDPAEFGQRQYEQLASRHAVLLDSLHSHSNIGSSQRSTPRTRTDPELTEVRGAGHRRPHSLSVNKRGSETPV